MNKFIIGLILGIAIAGGLAYYLNNTPAQFVNRVSNNANPTDNKSSAPIILAPSTQLQEVHNASQVVSSGATEQASAPSYDFYDILQGRKAADNTAKPENKPTMFYVQAGVFDSQNGANDMKAQLALLGIDAKIRSQQVSGKIINRIIIGPFKTVDEANDIVAQLKDNDIQAKLIEINK